jgi:hypothetical protein
VFGKEKKLKLHFQLQLQRLLIKQIRHIKFLINYQNVSYLVTGTKKVFIFKFKFYTLSYLWRILLLRQNTSVRYRLKRDFLTPANGGGEKNNK